jgi:hypothetical protein
LRFQNSWVLIQTIDQEIFPMPSPLVSRFQSEFKGWRLSDLGVFCKARFARTGLIAAEDFGIIDQRTLKDQTLLFARWEQYTPEDDAILRIVWGDSKPEDEAWLKDSFMTPEDAALLRKAEGSASISDEVVLRKFKEATVQEDDPAIERLRKVQDEAVDETEEEEVRSDSTQPDQHFIEQLQQAAAVKTPRERLHVPENPLPSPHLSRATHTALERETTAQMPEKHVGQRENLGPTPKVEILEGLRTIRVPIATAMRDIALIYSKSITDLLKIPSLFNEERVLKY